MVPRLSAEDEEVLGPPIWAGNSEIAAAMRPGERPSAAAARLGYAISPRAYRWRCAAALALDLAEVQPTPRAVAEALDAIGSGVDPAQALAPWGRWRRHFPAALRMVEAADKHERRPAGQEGNHEH